MPITACRPILRPAHSNAFDVNNSHSRASDSRPLLSQYRTDDELQESVSLVTGCFHEEIRDSFRGMESSLPDERLVFIDLETAGAEPWRPIIQIAAIALTSDLQELECFEAKILFAERIADSKSLRKPHYSLERWQQEGRPVKDVLNDFSDVLRRHATVDQVSKAGAVFQVAQIVAHNAAFDSAFLNAWFARFDSFLPASPRVLCTMQRAIWLFHEDKRLTPPPDFKLGTLCSYFGVPLRKSDAHDALADVRATVELYRAMNKVSEAGQTSRGVSTARMEACG